ncbi:MAG: hypothetical protein IJO57_02365 [Bacilli bacterium]|nr:hypothetical protein [Bacilli bacterium]
MERKIPLKNYIILGVILIITFSLLYYFYLWFDKYEETKLNRPILTKYMDVINYNELDNYLVENPDAIIYVSVLNNTKIRDFEKQLKQKFKDDAIDNSLLYLDITNTSKKEKEDMEELYYFNNLNILDVPCILTFSSGELVSIYSVSDTGYNIDSFVMFVNQINYGLDDLDD